jgi:hypothetical protein
MAPRRRQPGKADLPPPPGTKIGAASALDLPVHVVFFLGARIWVIRGLVFAFRQIDDLRGVKSIELQNEWSKAWLGLASDHGVTLPLVLSAVVAGALVLDQAVALAAALAGTGVILLVVRSFAPQDDPLRDVGEVVLRGGESDAEWLENFRRRQLEASDQKLRMWRKNSWGAWLVIAALFVLLARAVIVWLCGQ